MINVNRLVEDYEIYYPNKSYPIDNVVENGENLLVDFAGSNFYFSRTTGVAIGYETERSPIRLRKKSSEQPQDFFKIISGAIDWHKDQWVEVTSSDDLDDIKATLAALQDRTRETDSPFRFMMKKDTRMVSCGDYHAWAEFRFASGEWIAPPWANEPWVKPEFAHHHPHLSRFDDVPKLDFWTSETQAQKESLSTICVGSYLTSYYHDVLTPQEIEHWVHKADEPGHLVFSGKDPEAIYEAYDDAGGAIHSCMVYRDDHSVWDEAGESPVRIYGGGDLEVATLIRRGRRVARALVWPEKMVAGRRYGDVRRMNAALLTAGYTLDAGCGNDMHAYGNGGFNGARLLRKEPEYRPGNLIMPYIDFHYRVQVMDDHCILSTDEGYIAHNTNGLLLRKGRTLSNTPYNLCCDHCGEAMEDGDEYAVGSETWCESCVDDAYYCEHCNDRCSGTDGQYLCADDHWYCYGCLENRAHSCDRCDETTMNAQEVTSADGTEVVGQWCPVCTYNHARYHLESNRVRILEVLEEA